MVCVVGTAISLLNAKDGSVPTCRRYRVPSIFISANHSSLGFKLDMRALFAGDFKTTGDGIKLAEQAGAVSLDDGGTVVVVVPGPVVVAEATLDHAE